MTASSTNSELLPKIQASKEPPLGSSSPSDADSGDGGLESSPRRVASGRNEEAQDVEVPRTDVDTGENSSNLRVNYMKNEDSRSSNAFIHQEMVDKAKTASNGIPRVPPIHVFLFFILNFGQIQARDLYMYM
ncbi:hypothetical protein K435DRAFT_845044 [Dendrothele bispora CBS 962.96]|uniref:Uncharacterized protein n=1 Tax=Dendrothele bispora (strain CBS 962.96) TaxID=1314807 RepID=A0A4S8KX95_DENBC|nr:hypothetical protein K435DRAFT_845044 [Dendrothele bispora CBS 962.96]